MTEQAESPTSSRIDKKTKVIYYLYHLSLAGVGPRPEGSQTQLVLPVFLNPKWSYTMTLTADKPENVLLRLRKQDTPTGVSSETIELLIQKSGMSKTEVIHLALRQFADRILPKYELDDGPLTDAQIAAIRAASPATSIPRDRFKRGLFKNEHTAPV